MFNPDDIPASSQEWRDALDRTFPPKTDAERAAYQARRERFRAELRSRRRWDKVFAVIDTTLNVTVFPVLAVLFAVTCWLVWVNL